MKLHSLNQISIPVPCHENWDTMAEAEKGRFCAVCQKTVVDFSQMNEQEILATLNETLKKDSICGRFHKNQLHATPSWKNKISQKLKYFALALLLAFGVPKVSKAQLHESHNEECFVKGDVEPKHKITISGTIKNKANNIVIAGADVQLWKDNQLIRSTKTNSNGFYEFKLAESGTYKLKVYKKDFVPYVSNIFALQQNTTTFDVEMYKTPPSTKPTHKVGKIHVE